MLSQFSSRLDRARKAYRKFVDGGKEDGHQQEYHIGSSIDNRILGDDTFIEKVLGQKPMRLKRTITLDEIVLKVCKRFGLEERDLSASGKGRKLSEVRGIVAWLVLELGYSTLAELGKRTSRDASTLSSAAKRLQIRSKMDLKLAQLMNELLEEVC